jgi:hypothetical protein
VVKERQQYLQNQEDRDYLWQDELFWQDHLNQRQRQSREKIAQQYELINNTQQGE